MLPGPMIASALNCTSAFGELAELLTSLRQPSFPALPAPPAANANFPQIFSSRHWTLSQSAKTGLLKDCAKQACANMWQGLQKVVALGQEGF